MQAEVIELAYDDDGLLYAPAVRDLIASSLDAGHLTGYETLMAMVMMWPAQRAFGLQLRKRYRNDRLTVLGELRRRRDGLRPDELSDALDLDDLEPLLAELQRRGHVTRPAGEEGRIRITDSGDRLVVEYLQRMTAEQQPLADTVAQDRLAVLRHVCLQLRANADARLERQAREVSGELRLDRADRRLEREEGLLYDPALREFLGPMRPDQILTYEATAALRDAVFSVQRFGGGAQGARGLPRMLVRLYRHPAGLPLTELAADLDRESGQLLAEAERAGAVTRSASPAGGEDLVRLTAEGRRLMDEYLRHLTGELTWRLDRVSPEHLPAVRDTCWRIGVNLARLVTGRP